MIRSSVLKLYGLIRPFLKNSHKEAHNDLEKKKNLLQLLNFVYIYIYIYFFVIREKSTVSTVP